MKSAKSITAALFLATLLAGCADYRPVVDSYGTNMANYEYDLRDCQNYARQVDGTAQAGGGALLGGVLGAAVGAVAGGNSSGIWQSAGVGAITGGAAGGISSASSQKQIIRNCLAGRGYRVLN